MSNIIRKIAMSRIQKDNAEIGKMQRPIGSIRKSMEARLKKFNELKSIHNIKKKRKSL